MVVNGQNLPVAYRGQFPPKPTFDRTFRGGRLANGSTPIRKNENKLIFFSVRPESPHEVPSLQPRKFCRPEVLRRMRCSARSFVSSLRCEQRFGAEVLR